MMVNTISPSSVHRGRTYGEWSAKWWQWAYSVPRSRNPLLDQDGQNSHEGQNGPCVVFSGHLRGGQPCPCAAKLFRACGQGYFRSDFERLLQ